MRAPISTKPQFRAILGDDIKVPAPYSSITLLKFRRHGIQGDTFWQRKSLRVAGATGLEPAASCVTGRRSNQLNYAPAWDTYCALVYLVPSCIARFPLASSRSLPVHQTVP